MDSWALLALKLRHVVTSIKTNSADQASAIDVYHKSCSISSVQSVAPCFCGGGSARHHHHSTDKKAASTNVHARTKASLNPPELGTGRLAHAALMLIPRFVYVHQTSQRSQVAMFQPPAIPSRQVSTTAILRITAATALACCLPQTACSACRPPGWDAAAAPAACPPECSTLPQQEAHRI